MEKGDFLSLYFQFVSKIPRILGSMAVAIGLIIGVAGWNDWSSPAKALAQSATACQPLQLPDQNALVYDNNHNGQADLYGDSWVFTRPDDPAIAALVVLFASDGTAKIYEAESGTNAVKYHLENCQVVVEQKHWRIFLQPDAGGWYWPSGKPNWNLQLTLDGNYTLFGADYDIQPLPPDAPKLSKLPSPNITYAHPFKAQYWDTNGDGIPEFEYNNSNPTGANDAFIVNKNPALRPTSKYSFFPLQTLLQMDWNLGKISLLKHLIPSRTNQQGYFIYFNKPNLSFQAKFGFEAPMAFYNLQGTVNGPPTLSVRAVTEDADVINNVGVYNEIRYSWSQNREGAQYRLYLIGRNGYNQFTTYPIYPIYHIPYEELPGWSLSQRWNGAIFAQDEINIYSQLGEGLYENLNYTSRLRSRLLDRSRANLPPYRPTARGIREEWNFDLNGYSNLYFSEIDQRLHLYQAKQGYYIVSATTLNDPTIYVPLEFDADELAQGTMKISEAVSWFDGGGAGYINSWEHLKDNQIVERLYLSKDNLVYSNSTQVKVKKVKANYQPNHLQGPPPQNKAEWEAFQQILPPTNQVPALNNLEGLFEQVPGSISTQLDQVSLTNCLNTANKITCQAQIDATSPLVDTGVVTQPGTYLFDSRLAEWFTPATPAKITLGPIASVNGASQIIAQTPQPIVLEIRNEGKTNQDKALLTMYEEGVSGLRVRILDQPLFLQADSSQTVKFDWLPSTGGTKKLIAEVRLNLNPTIVDEEEAIAEQKRSEAPLAATTLNTFEVAKFELNQAHLDMNGPPYLLIGAVAIGVLAAVILVFLCLTGSEKHAMD